MEKHSSKKIKNLKGKILGTILYLLFGLLFSVLIAFVLSMGFYQPTMEFARKYGDGVSLFILWISGIFASWGWVTINKWFSEKDSGKTVVVIRENENFIATIMLWVIKLVLKICFSILIGMFVAPKKFYELYKDEPEEKVQSTK